jgi:hypothetical protein
MRIEPAALAKAIGALDEADLDRGLGPSVLQLVTMVKQLFDADGVGLMLVDAEGMLRWAAASDQQASSWNRPRKHSHRGPAPMRSGSGRPCRSATSPARAARRSRRYC